MVPNVPQTQKKINIKRNTAVDSKSPCNDESKRNLWIVVYPNEAMFATISQNGSNGYNRFGSSNPFSIGGKNFSDIKSPHVW